MSLATELLKRLNDDQEPLSKRLKIADNAFKSVELSIPHREILLLKWISKLKEGDKNVWKQYYEWVTSHQMQELNRSDLSFEDVNVILKTIVDTLKTIKEEEINQIVLQITNILLQNRIFQQHFHYNLKNFCNFIANILECTTSDKLMDNFLRNENLFDKSLISEEKFHKYFIDLVLPKLIDKAQYFHENEKIFLGISKILRRCLFWKNMKIFEEYFIALSDEEKPKIKIPLPKILFKKLNNLEIDIGYKLIFHAFSMTYNNNSDLITKFILFIFNSIVDLEKGILKSSEILSEFLDGLNKSKIVFDISDYLRQFVISLIKTNKHPDDIHLKILQNIIEINPLVIESLIDQVIVYIMLADNRKNENYTKLLFSIFEMYAKLHRIQNLISKLIRALEGKLCDKMIDCKGNNYDVDVMLPFTVMDYFSQCISVLASWQVMNLYKTLLFHLGESIEKHLINVPEDNQKVFVEIISYFTYQFLSSVRIAEHTVSIEVLKKFLSSMEEMRGILRKFGTKLVGMQHDHNLMKAYLNICYVWAELYIIIHFYSQESEFNIKTEVMADYAACNLTYLHSYLTSEQWCLISERITNFGETPCKQIMQNLCIQKLRAMMVFEHNLPEEVTQSVVESVSTVLPDYYLCLLDDKFALSTITSKMDNKTILNFSNLIIQSKNYSLFKKVADCKILCIGILYETLEKITEILQGVKGKSSQKLSCKLFKDISMDDLIMENMEKIDHLKDFWVKEMENIKVSQIEIKYDQLAYLLKVIEHLPIIYLDIFVKKITFFYFSSLLVDVANLDLKEAVENILLGLMQNANFPLAILIKPQILTSFFINNLKNYKIAFETMFENSMKFECINLMKTAIKQIIGDIKKHDNMNCSVIALNLIQKHKKSKPSEEVKKSLENYKEKICDGIIKEIDENRNYNSMQAFALVLKLSLGAQDKEKTDKLQKHTQFYVDEAMSNEMVDPIGWLALFTLILTNKPKFESLIKPDFVLTIWNRSKLLKITSLETDLHNKLIIEIFGHIPNEQFENITKDLLQDTKKALEIDFCEYVKYIKIWASILGCSFNPTKMEVWQNSVQNLLSHICFDNRVVNEAICEEVINFEIKLIQNSIMPVTPTTVDIFFHTITQLMSSEKSFHKHFSFSITILDLLLKHRKPLLFDRLPSYLQQYRILVKEICLRSDSNKEANTEHLQETADCAHRFEKLTKNLVGLNKHIESVCMYLIADILQQYEKVTLYPAVKMHLDNCLFSLMSLCDQYAVSCLLRVLSTPSTEIFKSLYETYKKYYRFVGKV